MWTYAPRGPQRLFTACKCCFLFVSFTAVLSLSHRIIFFNNSPQSQEWRRTQGSFLKLYFVVWIGHSCSLSLNLKNRLPVKADPAQAVRDLFLDSPLNDDIHRQHLCLFFLREREKKKLASVPWPNKLQPCEYEYMNKKL